MDQEEIKNSIIERFNNLQPEIQAIIMDPDYEIKLNEIGKKYNLSTEQNSELEFNTTLVVLGQTHPDEYSQELVDDLKLPKEKIAEIVFEVNEVVLKPILGLLKQNFENDNKEEFELEETPIPPYVETINREIPSSTEIIPQKPEPIKISQEAPKNIIEEKLKSATVSEHAISDYTTRKINTTPLKANNLDSSPKSHDPYREEF